MTKARLNKLDLRLVLNPTGRFLRTDNIPTTIYIP